MTRDPGRMVRRCWKRLLPHDGETRRWTWRREELDAIGGVEWQATIDRWLGPAAAAIRYFDVPMKCDLHLDGVTDPNRVTLTASFHRG